MTAPPDGSPTTADRGGHRGLLRRVTRYSLGSVVALATSEVTFIVCFTGGLGTTVSSVLAFLAGVAPNWILNRRWAWQRRGRVRVGREVVVYSLVSLASLVASALATRWADHRAPSFTASHPIRVALVAGAYLATYGVLFLAKFAVFEWFVFAGPTDDGRTPHQVAAMTRAKRQP